MKKISRREAIQYLCIGSSVIAVTALNGCCSMRNALNIFPCEPQKDWKDFSRNWWLKRKDQRAEERADAIHSETRPDLQIPFPYLECWRQEGPHGTVMSQFSDMHFNEWGTFYVLISNKGNAASWNCIVESYETPFSAYNQTFNSFTLRDRIFVAMMPGESREIQLKFLISRRTGGINVRCYDPISDPGLLYYDQYDRHNNGFGWSSWQE